MAHEVFISHSSEDKVIADAVTAALEQAGIRCWIAPRDIRAGDSWGGAIVSAIESSKVMVVIFSARSNDSKQVMREVERAVQHDVVVVPFRIEDVKPSKDMEYFLSATHWLDAITPATDKHLAALVETSISILDRSEEDSEKRVKPNIAAHLNSSASKTSFDTNKKSIIEKINPRSLLEKFKTELIKAATVVIVLLGGYIWLTSGGDDVEDLSPEVAKQQVERSTADKLGERESGDIKLKVDDEAVAGSKLKVRWKGKSASNDYVVIAKKDSNDSSRPDRQKLQGYKQLEIRVPSEAGDYQVRFYNGKDGKVIARSDLEVELPSVSFDAPKSVEAGKTIQVKWQAPNYAKDYISIANLDSNQNKYQSYANTKTGSPTEIRVPDKPGVYQLRYQSGAGKTIWYTQKLKVTQPEVEIPSIDEQVAGANLEIKVKGPRNKGDYLTVAKIGSKPNKYVYYGNLGSEPEVKIKMPEYPGEYEVRYISGFQKQIWDSQKVEVEAAEASIKADSEFRVGSFAKVKWKGPNNINDFITVAEIGSDGKNYIHYSNLKDSGDVDLVMPNTPGSYEIRYISASKKYVWASQKIKVVPWSINLNAPEKVKKQKSFTVSWNDKGGKGQYVGIYKPNADSSVTYQYAENKEKLKFRAPTEPGEYWLRYYSSGSNEDRQLWAKKKLIVE